MFLIDQSPNSYPSPNTLAPEPLPLPMQRKRLNNPVREGVAQHGIRRRPYPLALPRVLIALGCAESILTRVLPSF